MACIIVASGTQRGLYLPIGQHTVVVGRDEGLLLQLRDELVSRKHLRIRYDPDSQSYFAADLDTANGTLHNGHPLKAEAPVKEHDDFVVGTTQLVFSSKIPESHPNALEVLRNAGQRDRSTINLCSSRRDVQRS